MVLTLGECWTDFVETVQTCRGSVVRDTDFLFCLTFTCMVGEKEGEIDCGQIICSFRAIKLFLSVELFHFQLCTA